MKSMWRGVYLENNSSLLLRTDEEIIKMINELDYTKHMQSTNLPRYQ